MFNYSKTLHLSNHFQLIKATSYINNFSKELYFSYNNIFKNFKVDGIVSMINNKELNSTISYVPYNISTFRSVVSTLAMISNGLTAGYFIELVLKGIGFKVFQFENSLFLQLGFSHFYIYRNVNNEVLIKAKRDRIIVFGANKQQVGNVAFEISVLRKPDSYKAKGLQFKEKFYALKEGKKK